MKRPNFSIPIYLCLVFLSGVLLGIVGLRLYNAYTVAAKSNPCSADSVRRRYVDEMQQRLKLNAGQVDKLKTILDETHDRFRTLREKYKPEVKAIQQDQVTRIRSILDAKQQVEYEKLREERDQPKKGSGC